MNALPPVASESTDSGRRTHLARFLLAASAVLVLAIAGALLVMRSKAAPDHHRKTDVPTMDGTTVVLTPPFKERLGLKFAPIRQIPLTPIVKVSGTVGFDPRSVAAVDAAVAMQRADKNDLLPMLTSRRELGLLRLRRLDLVAREWTITSELVAISGRVQ